MIISNAKRWKLRITTTQDAELFCTLCKKPMKKMFVLGESWKNFVFICTRCMKQINRATNKYFEGEKR